MRQNLAALLGYVGPVAEREVGGLDGNDRAAPSKRCSRLRSRSANSRTRCWKTPRLRACKMKDVAASLQAEAAQIQTILARRQSRRNQRRSGPRRTEILDARRQLSAERADAAYNLIDRTTAHYDCCHAGDQRRAGRARDRTNRRHGANAGRTIAGCVGTSGQPDRYGRGHDRNPCPATSPPPAARAVQNLSDVSMIKCRSRMKSAHDAGATDDGQDR